MPPVVKSWQQIVDLAVRVTVDDLCDDVGEVDVRFDAREFAGLDQRGDDGPMLAAAVRASEECVFSVQSDRPDRAFDDVGVDLDTAVVEEAGQALPARERIADCFSEFCLLTDQSELGAQPGFKFIDDRPAPPQPGVAPFLGAAAADIALDGIESGDAFERLAGDRRRAGRGEFVEASAYMAPAVVVCTTTASSDRRRF